ncbi:hypothetical protein PInf_017598 [Phytophthora infestans]|nr:hypothetical protein PInf_017598 [Phytophthora infestans]
MATAEVAVIVGTNMKITTWTTQDDEMTPDDVPVMMVEEAHMVGQEEVTAGMVVAEAMAVVTDGMTIIMTGVAGAVVSNADPQGCRSSAIGTAGENVVPWLDAVKQAQQMQMVLYGEDGTSGDLYYSIWAHLKGAVATKLDAQTPPEMKNAAYLEWHLGRTAAEKAPGSLTELGAGHPGLTSSFYVDAFARGLSNKISAQTVRTAKPLTLEQANCGRYGEGAEVNSWELAVQMHEKNRGHEAHHASAATTSKPTDQLDWTKLGLNIGASGD